MGPTASHRTVGHLRSGHRPSPDTGRAREHAGRAQLTWRAGEELLERVRALPALVVSALARVEVPAAIRRTVRTGQLPPQDAAVLSTAFRLDLSDPSVMLVVAPTGWDRSALAWLRP